jgi:hypothetical protein
MNRANLKILILVCALAAPISWFTGCILFGHASAVESDYQNQAQDATRAGEALSDDAQKLWLAFGHAAGIEKAIRRKSR